MKVVVTGGLGFIGSHLAKALRSLGFYVHIWDAHTYAANLDFLSGSESFAWRYLDITSEKDVRMAMALDRPDAIFHLAAESHVCRSIEGPRRFVETNVLGTFNLLEAARELCPDSRFVHVSTDEVFGEAEGTSRFSEATPYAPRSPYSASKASSDHLAKAYRETYGMSVTVTNCSNNFGPHQHEEKLIPRTIRHLLEGKEIIVHGKGDHVRDWIWVGDHVDGLIRIMDQGDAHQYLLGGECELTNIEVINMVIEAVAKEGLLSGVPLLRHTNDRPTDDRRYAVDPSLAKTLGWAPGGKEKMMDRLRETVRWYAARKG